MPERIWDALRKMRYTNRRILYFYFPPRLAACASVRSTHCICRIVRENTVAFAADAATEHHRLVGTALIITQQTAADHYRDSRQTGTAVSLPLRAAISGARTPTKIFLPSRWFRQLIGRLFRVPRFCAGLVNNWTWIAISRNSSADSFLDRLILSSDFGSLRGQYCSCVISVYFCKIASAYRKNCDF